MMVTNKLSLQDKLPLTCTRTGTCCHGKIVLLNPWELVCLAREKGITPREFRDQYCEYGGIRLQFNGKAGWKNQPACSQYDGKDGCSVHSGRPLSCRLYPLGRQIQSNVVHYIYQGAEFPCLDGCSEVYNLAHLRVEDYLKGQFTEKFEFAQDAYLDLMQNLAEIALVLLLDTDLALSGDKKTLPLWRSIGIAPPEVVAGMIGQEWMDWLMLPDIPDNLDPVVFARKHNDMMLIKAHEKFGALQTNLEIHEASVLIMGVALHLVRGLGADPKIMAEHWIDTAKSHGAIE